MGIKVKTLTKRSTDAPPKVRDSNIELLRIVTMLLIVAHHYVVNSGLTAVDGPIYADPMSWRSIFLLIFGAWGKAGINCFVFISGYYMCTSNMSLRKYVKLLGEVMFYRIVIWCVFWLMGQEHFSVFQLLSILIPITSIKTGFTQAFLVFYLSVPFLNLLIRSMNEGQHIRLLMLCGFVYVFLGTIPILFEVQMNYFSWFIVMYFIAAYVRLYPKSVYGNKEMCLAAFVLLFTICVVSIIGCAWICAKYHKHNAYMLMTDSNTFLAVVMSVSAFLVFKNLSIGYSKLLNSIAISTFGVLLIHAHSDIMRQLLWGDMVDSVGHYNAKWMPLHAFGSVLMVFSICVVLDKIRIRWIERPFLILWDTYEEKICKVLRLRIKKTKLRDHETWLT